jgi:DNA-binding transcriptional ArsR family regulator
MADDRCDLLCLDLPRAETIRASLDPAIAETAAARAKALGDPTRLLIALALRAESLVGHHLRQLRIAGLARSRRDGKIAFYALTDTGLALLDAHLAARPASA